MKCTICVLLARGKQLAPCRAAGECPHYGKAKSRGCPVVVQKGPAAHPQQLALDGCSAVRLSTLKPCRLCRGAW